MKVNFTVDEERLTPTRAHDLDAGLDLRAGCDFDLPAGGRALVPTGVSVEIPEGYVGLVCSRSGLAEKYGIHVLNAPGIVDSGYTGQIKVNLQNDGSSGYGCFKGERIAQLVIVPIAKVDLQKVEKLGNTKRGEKGHGSTGK